MKNDLKLEEAAVFGLCVIILANMGGPWWVYVLLAIGADISIMGYMINKTMGAFCYNFFHHKGIAVAVFVIGVMIDSPSVSIIGIVLFGHSSMDRMLGYGLKLKEGFKYTHREK